MINGGSLVPASCKQSSGNVFYMRLQVSGTLVCPVVLIKYVSIQNQQFTSRWQLTGLS